MKKLIYGSLFLALVGMGMVGCKKENVQQNENRSTSNEFGVSTDGKMLIFNTLEDYEKAVDGENENKREFLFQTIKKLKFENYFSKASSNSISSEDEMDDFLGQLLNPDGAIQIENHIYKIDLANEKVYVVDVHNKETDYEDLVIGNTSNKKISEYSTDDDVLYAVKNGIIEKCGGIGSFDNSSNVVSLDNSGQIKFDSNCKYFQGGIYFRVTGRVEYTEAFSGTAFIALEIQSPEAWMKRKPCGSGTITTHHAGERVSGYHYRHLFEAYSKTRAINGIYMFVRARAEITPPGQPKIIKYTTWTGKNVNSPY